MAKEKRKAKTEKGSGGIIKLMIIIAFILFTILVTRMAINYYTSIVKKDIAYTGKLIEQINISGLVLYEYDSYDTIESHSLIKTAKEGSKVAVNSLIGSLVNTRNPLYQELEDINAQILTKQQIYKINTGILAKDLELIDLEIRSRLLSVSATLENQSLNKAYEYKEQIQSYYEYKQDVKSGNNKNEHELTDLYSAQKKLKQAMASDVRDIYCNHSGYLSYNMYNNQQYHTYDQVKALNPEELKDQMNFESGFQSNTVIKVATSKKFHIATVLSSSEAARIKDSNSLKIYINTNGMDFYVNISKIIIGNSVDGQTVVFFETDNLMSQLVSIGRFDGLLVIKEYIGLKVPISSIYNYKYSAFQKTQIALVKGISVKFVYIDVLYSDETYAIVLDADDVYSFKAYDYYILEPYKVTDGDVVN